MSAKLVLGLLMSAAVVAATHPLTVTNNTDDKNNDWMSNSWMSAYLTKHSIVPKNLTNDGVRRIIADGLKLISDLEAQIDEFNTILAKNNSYQGASVRMTEGNLALIKSLTMSEVAADKPSLDSDKAVLSHIDRDIGARPKASVFMRNLIVSDILRRLKGMAATVKKVIIDRVPTTTEESSTAVTVPHPLIIDWSKIHNVTEEDQTSTTPFQSDDPTDWTWVELVILLSFNVVLGVFMLCLYLWRKGKFSPLLKVARACCTCNFSALTNPNYSVHLNEIRDEFHGGANKNVAEAPEVRV